MMKKQQLIFVVAALAVAAAAAALPVQQQQQQQQEEPTTTDDDVYESASYRGRRRPRRNRPARPQPPPVPVPAPPSPPAAGTPPLLPCNRSVVPPMLAAGQSASPSSPWTTDCEPTRPPTPPPRHSTRCVCPAPKPHPPGPGPGLPLPGSGGSSTDCVAPLAALMTCGSFITGSDDERERPTPDSDCCTGLGVFLNTSSALAAAGGGDRLLRCLCPVILGDVNRRLPKPIDPVRLMYLPIACGIVLPPQVLYICFTGQHVLVEKPTPSAAVPP